METDDPCKRHSRCNDLHANKKDPRINGEILNLGSSDNVYQLKPLAERVALCGD